MARFSWPLIVTAGVLAALSGCSGFDHRERPAWRTQAEEVCLAEHRVQETAWIKPSPEIDGPGICGLHHPFKVRGLADGTVTLNATATLDCSMIPALDGWIRDVLQPAAQARLGEPVVEIKTMGAYNCRGINNESGANLSEHAFGNAIDVGSFVLQSGRELEITRGWKSDDAQERAFLHEAHAGACGYFTTVLGPGSNIFHYNHYHLDLAMHGNTSRGLRRICKPVPEEGLPLPPQRDNLPDPPPIEEEMDVAQTPRPAPDYDGPGARSAIGLAAAQRTPARDTDSIPQPDLSQAEEPPDVGRIPRGTPAEWDLTSSIKSGR